MDPEFFPRYNNKGETAREIFMETHKDLVEKGGSWLIKTSKSCSVVAALIGTIAFTAATSLPNWGGDHNSSSLHPLEGRIIASSSLIALCFSVMSLVLFLSFLACRYEPWDFETDLPFKLILNLTSLYVSLAATAVCFCAGYSFLMQQAVYQYYVGGILSVLVSIYSLPLIPLYIRLIKAKFVRLPEPALPAPEKWYVR